MLGDNLKSGNATEFALLISNNVGKNNIVDEAEFLASNELTQRTLSMDYIENVKGVPIARVKSPADFTGGITNKHDEYCARILTAFNKL